MSRDPLRIAIACLFALLFLAVFLYGWVTDDAFITFRVVRNFLAGDGPVYNLGERVQAYTHPLWFWLLSVGIGLGAESYHFALWLGCTTIGVFYFRLGPERWSWPDAVMQIFFGSLFAWGVSFYQRGLHEDTIAP